MGDTRAAKLMIKHSQPVTVAMFLSLLCAPLENIIIVDGSMDKVIYDDTTVRYDDTDVVKMNDYDFSNDVPIELLDRHITQIITDDHCNFIINIGKKWDLLHY